MVIVDGWLTWATRRPGPPEKVYSQTNAGMGIVVHSVEGWLAGAFGELDKPERQASWMFTCGLDGTLYQHYPITASCWASGNFTANTLYWSMELEGMAPTAINDAQMATVGHLIAEWEHWSGKAGVRPTTLLEHREVATKWIPNAGGTSCPSERYAPLWAAVEGDMTKDELYAELVKLRLITMKDGEPVLGGQSSVASLNDWIDTNVGPLITMAHAHAMTDAEVAEPGITVPDHKHDPGGVTP